MKVYFYCFLLALGITLGYSFSNQQFSDAFRAFLNNPSQLPAFFASDYFSGLEYGYIGYHLTMGHGFAGPFYEVTAPTGTMPPVLPLVYAGIYALCGFKTVFSFWTVFLLRTLAVAGGFALLIRVSESLRNSDGSPRQNAIVLTALAFALVFATGNLFFFFYDEWFMWFLVCLASYWALKIFRDGSNTLTGAILFGIFIGFLILTQTVLGAAMLCATVMAAIRFRRHILLWAVPVAIAVAMIWVIRNYMTFDSFMPVKSNLGFELYFSTVHEPKGILILEEQNASGRHPIKEGREKQIALGLGEQEYQRRKTQEFLEILKERPGLYLSKVAYRLMYSTVTFPFSREEAKVQAPAPAILKYVLYPCVFFLWLMQWFMPGKRDPFMFFLLCLYAAYLAPYILINFWLKYWVHLLPVYVLIVTLSATEFYQRHIREDKVGH